MAPRAFAVRPEVLKLLRVACSGNVKLFKKLAKQLDNGKGLARTVADAKDVNNRGALLFAAQEGKVQMCKYLVEELKIDVNEQDVHGETPVLSASRQGHIAIIQYLIEKGADPAIPSAEGPTALHVAAGIGHVELIKLFLSKGVDVDLQSDVGTPLMWAAGLGEDNAVKVLLEHHANPNAKKEGDNMCPLASAVAANSFPCVELLVKAGANVNARTSEPSPSLKDGEATPLLIAAYRGIAEIINCLLQAGADPNATDEDGNKPIHVAASRGNRAAVEALLAVTPRIKCVPEWSVDGVIEFMQSEYSRKQEQEKLKIWKKAIKSREDMIPKRDLPQVTPEAKKKAAEAKARGDEAFKKKDFAMAICGYTQAINFDPTDATLFSNRSLCWIRLGQGEHALCDAKACRELRPYWAKGCYREGAALRLLQRHVLAVGAFCEGVLMDPENEELQAAFREAMEAGKKFYGVDEENSSC